MNQPILAILGEMLVRYPRQEVPAATLKGYADDLKDIPIDALRAVCQRLWLAEEWFPSVAKIRATWGELMVPDAAAADFEWVLRRMSQLAPGEKPNAYSSVVREPASDEYPSSACYQTVQSYGWRRLYDTDPHWLRKEWATYYAEARQVVIDAYVAAPVAIEVGHQPALKAVS